MFSSIPYTSYFGHGKCFIWGSLVLAFIKSVTLTTTYMSWQFFVIWKWNNSGLLGVLIKLLVLDVCPKFWAMFILKVSYLKHFLNIIYHSSIAIILETVYLVLFGDCGNFSFRNFHNWQEVDHKNTALSTI